MLENPNIKPTFFNTRKDRIHWNYTDTNNYLFIIFFDTGATLNFILRDLKKNENIKNYIYKKLNEVFGNIAEIEISKLSYTEYHLMKQKGVPSINKIC
tara:strand:+ start:287 stop:580 length:294 start_codon:yes stop_codon:yes gene_type:complete